MDKYEVSNLEFALFVHDTGYVSEAESFNSSFVLSMLLSERVSSQITQAVQGAMWWLPVNESSWFQPEGPGSNVKDR